MNPDLPPDIDPDLIAKTKGSLLIDIIIGVLFNRWTTGWGLLSRRGANGGVISLDPNVLPVPNGETWFWAKITGNAANGTNKWKYAWSEQERASSGWSDLSDGRSGTTSTNFALNSIEANNDGAGIQGNSVDIDGPVFTDNSDLEIQPVQGDPVVRMWEEPDTNGGVAYSFEYVNAIDGECA